MIKIVNADTEEKRKQIYDLYMRAFPADERKPFSVIEECQRRGCCDILSIQKENEKFAGLAITLRHKEIVLLDYFAVEEQFRGEGIGSESLRALQDKFCDSAFILEIESTRNLSDQSDMRFRRKNFYLRNGMQMMDYVVMLFGVEMEMMTSGTYVSYEAYYKLYREIFGKRIEDKVKLVSG